jgi:hypothetical protein
MKMCLPPDFSIDSHLEFQPIPWLQLKQSRAVGSTDHVPLAVSVPTPLTNLHSPLSAPFGKNS